MSKKKYTEPMIACPSCGVDNRISSPFCKHCGSRIYVDGKAPNAKTTSTQERSSASRALRSSVNALLFIVLVAIFGLALWPYSSLRVPLASDPGNMVERYLMAAENALENENPLPLARFPESNINAYLGKNNLPDENKLLGTLFSGRELDLIANEPLGPFNVSTRIVLSPSEKTNQLEVSDFWIGHLPLPAFWAKPWSQSVSRRFKLNTDYELWDHLDVMGIEEENLYIKLQL